MVFMTSLVLLAMLLVVCLFHLSCITKCVTEPQVELIMFRQLKDFPGSSDNKESACNAGDPGSIPGLGRSPGGRMATHSSILAWRIPWTEEPGGLQSMGLQRVGHD